MSHCKQGSHDDLQSKICSPLRADNIQTHKLSMYQHQSRSSSREYLYCRAGTDFSYQDNTGNYKSHIKLNFLLDKFRNQASRIQYINEALNPRNILLSIECNDLRLDKKYILHRMMSIMCNYCYYPGNIHFSIRDTARLYHILSSLDFDSCKGCSQSLQKSDNIQHNIRHS